ncbi:MAG: anti-sigma F factor [Clostridiales bacterium]|nr:anti-sigma F factor [Clostridiales bacterium]
MDKINEMRLRFLSKSSNESFARVTIAAFASQMDPTLGEISDIKTAISEAVTNAIIHGYEDKTGYVEVYAAIYPNKFVVEVSDEGVGIDDIEKARQPLYTSKPELERSGMGFTVMETFMDELKVISAINQGTKVRMVKYIRSSINKIGRSE